MSLRCVIGLGANLGDRRATFESAVRQLSALGELRGVSQLYETAPVGPAQPDYFNAAVCLLTDRTPHALLDRLLEVEAAHGRVRRERWGPRHLDLDVLWIEGLAAQDERLTVPHPRLLERSFALVPLIEVAPDARDPSTGLAYSDLPTAKDRTGMRVRGTPVWEPGSECFVSGNDSLWCER